MDGPEEPDRELDEEAKAAATPIRLGVSRGNGAIVAEGKRGYRLVLPRPPALGVALWIWVATSASYVLIGAVAAYIRVFQLPDGESEFYRLVPGPADSRFWAYLGLGVGANLARLSVVVAALRSTQAATWVRVGWIVALASSLLHPADFLLGLGAEISSIETARTSPAPVAVAGVASLVLLVFPRVIEWVWRPPEIHVPDWAYKEDPKSPPSEETD